MGREEVRHHERGGIGICQCVVGTHDRDAVTFAEIAEPVAQLSVGIESTRQVEGAQTA